MDEWVLYGGVFVLFIAVSAWNIANARKRTQEWVDFAQAKGLMVQGRWPDISMHGALDGTTFSLRQWRTRSGKHTHHHMHVTVPITADLGDLSVTQEGLVATLGKVLGGQDIQVGDPEFDGAFMIRCSQDQLAERVLTPSVRGALAAVIGVLETSGEVGLYEGGMHFRRSGSTNPEQLEQITAALGEAASAIGR